MQDLAIDVSGRSPREHPGGIPYRLVAEACIPSINVDDLGSIFEEHHVCKSISVGLDSAFAAQRMKLLDQSCGGVYSEDDRRFVFSSALVGIKSKARFKISNIKKVCTSVNPFCLSCILNSVYPQQFSVIQMHIK